MHRKCHKPPHTLCHGYQRANAQVKGDEQGTLSGIPGIVLHYPNSHVGTLRSRVWSEVLNLLGKDGEEIMLDMILECAIYAAVKSGGGNYYQLSGRSVLRYVPEASKS